MVLFFFFLGLFSIITQSIILRQIILFFYGNEFFLGIILAIWLLGTASGSFFAQKLFKKLFFINFALSLLFFPFLIFVSSYLRSRFYSFGETPSLTFAFFVNFSLLFIFCFLVGSLFTLGVKFFQKKKSVVAFAYLWETLGMATGGIIFSFVLVNLPLPFEKELLGLTYPSLVEYKNSSYGKIIVNKNGGQFNFFETGSLIGTTDDFESNEHFYHTIFSLVNSPQKVLLIGGGLTGGITEILKYPVSKVDYVELDPALLDIINKYLPLGVKKSFSDPRLKIRLTDGRRFLKNNKRCYSEVVSESPKENIKMLKQVQHDKCIYDLIIFNLPNPSTFLINRFFTKEVYSEVKKLLAPEGVFATSLSLPVDYLSNEAVLVGGSVYKSLKTSFPHVLVLPTERILFLSGNKEFLIDEEKIRKKWQDQNIKTHYFNPEYLFSNLSSPRVKEIYNRLAATNASFNSDFLPSAVYYQTGFWQTYFSFNLAKIQTKISQPLFILVLSFLLFVICYLLIKKISGRNFFPLASVFLSGFTLMSLGLLILYLYQIKIGYLYSQVALLIGIILGACGVGVALINSKFEYRNSKQYQNPNDQNSKKCFKHLNFENLNLFRISDFVLRIFSKPQYIIKIAFTFLIFLGFFLLLTLNQWNNSVIFYLFGSLVGFFTGFIFPSASKIYYQDKKAGQGVLYATDLLGSLFGSLFPTLFWFPILGVYKTVLIILFLLFTFLILFP